MSIIRQDLSTREWTIFALNRSKRPTEFKKAKERKIIKEYESSCPFCGGNERMTPKEVFSIKTGNKYSIRVVPNKFPALEQKKVYKNNINRHITGLYLSIDGVGSNEVVIESPKHNDNLYNMELHQVENIIKAYKKRFIELSINKGNQLIVIFRNHGCGAGISLSHPHSQIIAVPFTPGFVRGKIYESERYFDDMGKCVFCAMKDYEAKVRKRIICENQGFIAFAPYASVVPYNILIMPKEHQACFAEIPDSTIKDLASILKTVLKKLYNLLGDPDYNYIIDSAPIDQAGNRYYHWHLEILPRLITRAGFEIGSGININTILPEKCAKLLRENND